MNKTSITAQLNRQDLDRLRGYRELLDFYHGRQWEGRERRGEKRLTFNYSKVFIDKVASYLMSGVNFAVEAAGDSEEDKTKAQRAEAALHQAYEDNNLEQLDLETEIDCAILGDACYKVIWDGEAKKVRITAPDVQGIYAWWLGDDTSRIWRVASKYSLTAEEAEFLYQVKPRAKQTTVVELWTEGEFELYLDDALIEHWRARHQFRWNKTGDEMSVKELLAFVLARVGLNLEVKSQSTVLTGFYPDFTINPNNSGTTLIQRLLSFVPDVLFIEGNKAYLVNPLPSDASDYAYGPSHPIFEGRYRAGAWGLNRVQVEGYDPVEDEPIVVDSFTWDEIDRLYDRLRQIEDRNIDTVAKAEQRGEAYLRSEEVESINGSILVPVNCGQQLYDVVAITDNRTGLEAAKRRVSGLTLAYSPRRGEYQQRLSLGGV